MVSLIRMNAMICEFFVEENLFQHNSTHFLKDQHFCKALISFNFTVKNLTTVYRLLLLLLLSLPHTTTIITAVTVGCCAVNETLFRILEKVKNEDEEVEKNSAIVKFDVVFSGYCIILCT